MLVTYICCERFDIVYNLKEACSCAHMDSLANKAMEVALKQGKNKVCIKKFEVGNKNSCPSPIQTL